MPSKYEKRMGDHNVSSGNELGSHNYNHFDASGAAPAIAVGFVASLVAAGLVWLIVRYGAMVGAAVVGLFVLAVVGAAACFVVFVYCFCRREISRTQAQLSYDSYQCYRNNVVDAGPTAITIYDPRTQQYRVANAQQVAVNYHHQAPAVQVRELSASTDELDSEFFSQVLERDVRHAR